MNILLLGGTGFIGSRVADLLRERGHTVTLAGRSQINLLDLNEESAKSCLRNQDVVVNMVGVMSRHADVLETVHHHAPLQLAKWAAETGVKHWVQLSALGADAAHNVAFVGSKGRSDQALSALGNLTVNVARPSVVFGRGGKSCEMFIQMAKLPVLGLPSVATGLMQPVHVDDVALGLVKLAEQPLANGTVVNMVGSMIAVFRDFQTQPALAFNQNADILFGKLVAYITFLEKRHDQIFVVQSAEEWRQAHQASALPLKEIRAKTQEKLAAYRDTQEKIRLQTELLAKPAGFWDKLFKTKDTQAAKLEHLKNQRRSLSNEVYRALQDLLKQHDANLVNLEFDSQLISDDKMRHYALAHGDNGITDLPAILKLPESRATFDYEQFAEQLAALDEA